MKRMTHHLYQNNLATSAHQFRSDLNYISILRLLSFRITWTRTSRHTHVSKWSPVLSWLSKSKSGSCIPMCSTSARFAVQRLDPTMFGHPNKRTRMWRVCFHSQRKKWDCVYTLQQLSEMMLAHGIPVKLNYGCYLVASARDLANATYETDLSRQVPLSKRVQQIDKHRSCRCW